ncbi:MAG: hemerythrin family protein [Bryobacterales bacterium]|nr:hemerythrin family protein [Bryobacterales bacterium]
MAVLLSWKAEHLLNLPEFDDQHIAIVEKLNSVHAAILSGKSRSTLVREWHALLELLREHFAAEERLMKRERCPSLERHKNEHDYLLRMAGRMPLTSAATSLVREWLLTHLKGSDTQMADELRSR